MNNMKSFCLSSGVVSLIFGFGSFAVVASANEVSKKNVNTQSEVNCGDYISAKQDRLLRMPGLDTFIIEDKFDAGFETWFSGTVQGAGHFSGSYSGSSFYFSEDAGEVQQGKCTNYGIFGDSFTLR